MKNREDKRSTFYAVLYGLHQSKLMMKVQACRRFVKKENAKSALVLAVRKLDENTREVHELLFAARQRSEHAISQMLKVEFRECAINQRFEFAILSKSIPHAHDVDDCKWEGNVDVLR